MNTSDNARRLETAVITTLTETGMPTEEEISSLASQLRLIPIYKVTDEEYEKVIRRLHQALRIDMGLGSRVVDDYTPWLQARKSSIEPYYWKRYQLQLKKQGWAPKVVNALDKVTDEILDLSGNPASNSGWPRRGLVMGDVQSGKTSNYTGLICKAADAGYRLVILLTGTLESLRRQTQERLDSGFVGLDSSGVVTRNTRRREIGVGLINGARSAGVFTSTLVDFRATTVNQLGFKLAAFKEPVLLVVKKNKRILENLTTWLRDYNAGADGTSDLPLLLIDDEADNASVNTNSEKATSINAAIRSLLQVFPRSTYVGFTATPFANVFIHPDSSEEMLGDDLFPRDFVYALEAPTNYIGAGKIFGEYSKMGCLHIIDDAEPKFPRGHKSSHPVTELPPSLIEAVGAFLLSNAIMDLRTETPKHRSMLVNVSHYTEVQNQVREHVDEIVRQMQEDIRNYSSLSIKDAVQNRTIRALRDLFERDYSNVGFEWAEIQGVLASATLPIIVRAVNQKTGASSLDYSQYSQSGLRLIAVGGNSLSRGITLEGLCVSYFHRNTQMYDTLLQMGRWFGYRPNYDDLLRIWISDEAANWYAHIAEATEELRREIRHMQNSGLRPSDFGMRVRAHPESLLITARNKMRNSASITRVLSISGEGLETPRLLTDEGVIIGNYRAAMRLVEKLASSTYNFVEDKNPLWHAVSKDLVVEMLRSFAAHPLNISFRAEDLAAFIEFSDDDRLKEWDIVIPNGSSNRSITIAENSTVKLQKRKLLVTPEQRSILVNEKKMRVGSRGVEKEGMSASQVEQAEQAFRADPINSDISNVPDRAYRIFRTRPLLILHFLEGSSGEVPFEVPPDTELVAIGLSFPLLKKRSERVTYRINIVEIRNMLAIEASELEEEEDDIDED